ncbi:MAG: Fe-S cluster assembly protein IscX [Alphaproteobacteria bacterium]
MRWTDIEDIAIGLEEEYPETDILALRFTELWQMVQKLHGFADDPQRSNEKILEAIQMAWLEERQDSGPLQPHVV